MDPHQTDLQGSGEGNVSVPLVLSAGQHLDSLGDSQGQVKQEFNDSLL